MNMEDMILVSTDDHIVEPPDMFDHHTPAKYKDQFPKMVKITGGAMAEMIAKDGWPLAV